MWANEDHTELNVGLSGENAPSILSSRRKKDATLTSDL